MADHYVAPELTLDAFTCPHCGAYSSVSWFGRTAAPTWSATNLNTHHLAVARCDIPACLKVSVWYYSTMILPAATTAPPASSDMPDDVRVIYDEAASIVQKSPRAAGALLRLGIELLCRELTNEENLNQAIGKLKARGLRQQIVDALDVVRVTGNSQVHPGQIEPLDAAGATTLFRLVNLICEQVITEERLTSEALSGLPQGALEAIARRDGTDAVPPV